MSVTRLNDLSKAAQIYGQRSFDNYAQIRSIAEQIRDGLCAWLDSSQKCVFLVPPQGAFKSENYGSAAFSVAGKGFLPLEPISFGLAVRISEDDDFMRLVMTARKEGERMFLSLDNGKMLALALPAQEAELATIFETLYEHLLQWFTHRVDNYDNGDYGSTDIGFDIQRAKRDL